MSKFKRRDLLEYFDGMCLFLANHHWKIGERAAAIRGMIWKNPGVAEGKASREGKRHPYLKDRKEETSAMEKIADDIEEELEEEKKKE